MKYIIGTRGSKLALVQAELVRDKMVIAYPQDEFEIKVITTTGDRVQSLPLNQIGAKGVFVTEIEEQILAGQVDIGVHSMKDMPSEPESGLVFTRAWKREDPRDALILREKNSLAELASGAVIGTGSPRRAFQLQKLCPDIKVVGIRGNVDTRLKKMQEQRLDGIILAAAGLKRLGMENVITEYLDDMVSAPAQGILALEVRRENFELISKLDALSDPDSENFVIAERGFLSEIGGDCHLPVGACCSKTAGGEYSLQAMFGTEDGSRLAFASVTGKTAEKLPADAARKIREQLSGTVYIVGAGPGDPGLITCRGLECIRSAQCIIYDRLSAPELLDEAAKDCEKIYVGKENKKHTMTQEQINLLLVKKAMQYARVVRLKGGDPFVFGRGGEECLKLRECGVRFEVIPGVSSCTAGVACAGIPVTHRGMASGFRVVTAHDSRDELADIDFASMANGRETCVFLMGLSKLDEICQKLLSAGMSEATPAAVVSKASTAMQKSCFGTISDIGGKVRQAGLESPALIVVGDTVSLHGDIDYFERRSLFGQKYLLPKIGSEKTPLADFLRERGAYVRELQVGSIRFIDPKISPEIISSASAVVFTSKNGVKGFFAALKNAGLDSRCLFGKKLAAVGTATAECLESYGIIADFIPEKYNCASLSKSISELINCESEKTLLYPKAVGAKNELTCRGDFVLCELEVYENEESDIDAEDIDIDDFDGVVFTSASSAIRLSEAIGGFVKAIVFSIGPSTTLALKNLGLIEERIIQSDKASIESLEEKIIECSKN